MERAERYPSNKVSLTSFFTMAFLAPGTSVRSHTFVYLCTYVHPFWRHPSRPAWVPPGISHQPSRSWAWSSFSTLPEDSAPYYLYWQELPALPCLIRAALFFYPAYPVYYLTHSRMLPAMIVLKLRAATRWDFFLLRGYFPHFYNYWSHFDLKFPYWPGIE